ncbi:MAG: EamA family transporter RarD [Candidatus Nanopelagicales bacterium]
MAPARTAPRSDHTSGLLFAMGAFGLWGVFPLYFSLFDGVNPIEVVAYRILWSFLFCAILLFFIRGWSATGQALRNPRQLGLLTLASIAIAINWTTYVYSVSTDQVVESALGYFINPLVTVAMGVVILHERLNRNQVIAVAIAAVGVITIGFAEGVVPWIGLTLALSFGTYGLLKKMAGVGAVPGLTVETLVLLPIAAIALGYFEVQGSAAVANSGWGMGVLLALLGPITAIPLMWYSAAANRLPLATLGVMQYFTPTVIFILGITVFGDYVNSGEWVGFGLIWIALAVFSVDGVRRSRRPSDPDEAEAPESLETP